MRRYSALYDVAAKIMAYIDDHALIQIIILAIGLLASAITIWQALRAAGLTP